MTNPSRRSRDLFISYSSKDRRFVERLAKNLEAAGLSVWYDRWEMRPGDRLRDRINEGIERSRYFFVVLSPNSVDASWVRVELDAAMLIELSRRRVVVVPLLYGSIRPTQIPADLRGKHYVDFRSSREYWANVKRLVELFDLDRKHLRDKLAYLRRGAPGETDPIAHLTDSLRTAGRSQSTERAVIGGLASYPASARATNAIAERLLDPWGMSTLTRAVEILPRFNCGLLVLAATLFFDDRFIYEKAHALSQALLAREFSAAASTIQQLVDNSELFLNPSSADRWIARFAALAIPDVAEGAVFGSMYEGVSGWHATAIRRPPETQFGLARAYVASRLPGLVELFDSRLKRKA